MTDNYILIAVITGIFLAITAFLGWLGFKRTKNTADYLLAGRQVHPVIMAISYGATFISTSAIIGFGGAAANLGMGILWLTFLNILVGIFIAFVLFGKRTRKIGHNLDAHTFPELIGKRFDSTFLQGAAGLLIFVAMPLYAGSVIIGGVQFIKETLPFSNELAMAVFVGLVALYVLFGGMKGVMYTDAFQGAIMFVGMMILLIATYAMLGGVVPAHQALNDLASQIPAPLQKGGLTNWTDMPGFGTPIWMSLVTTIVMGVGIGVLAQPQLVVRFMTVKSDRELNRGVAIGGLFILAMTGVAFIVGSLSNVWFFQNTGKIAVAAAGGVDAVIPTFINKAMPAWFTALFMVTLLAAAMSTLSSQFHTMGSAFGRDFLQKGLKLKSQNTVAITKISMLFAIAISTIIALLLPVAYGKGGVAIIATGTSIFFGICAATFLPLYAGALWSKNITKAAALACFFTGLGASTFWLVFVKTKEASIFGICKTLFGVDSLAGKDAVLGNLDSIMVALPLSIIVTIIVSRFTKKPAASHVAACFDGVGAKTK